MTSDPSSSSPSIPGTIAFPAQVKLLSVAVNPRLSSGPLPLIPRTGCDGQHHVDVAPMWERQRPGAPRAQGRPEVGALPFWEPPSPTPAMFFFFFLLCCLKITTEMSEGDFQIGYKKATGINEAPTQHKHTHTHTHTQYWSQFNHRIYLFFKLKYMVCYCVVHPGVRWVFSSFSNLVRASL